MTYLQDKIIYGSKTGEIIIFDIAENKIKLNKEIQAHKERIASLSTSQLKNDLLYCGCKNGTLSYWNIQTGECLRKMTSFSKG